MRRTQWKIKRWWKIQIYDHIDSFFYDYYDNGVAGPGYSSHKQFRYGLLALIISVLTLIGFILFLILR